MGQLITITVLTITVALILCAGADFAIKMKNSQALLDAAARHEYRDLIDVTRSLNENEIEMALNDLSLQELNVIDAVIEANIAAEIASEIADIDEDKIKKILHIGKPKKESTKRSYPNRSILLDLSDPVVAKKYLREFEHFKEHSKDLLRLNRARINSLLRYEVALAHMRADNPSYLSAPKKKTTYVDIYIQNSDAPIRKRKSHLKVHARHVGPY